MNENVTPPDSRVGEMSLAEYLEFRRIWLAENWTAEDQASYDLLVGDRLTQW